MPSRYIKQLSTTHPAAGGVNPLKAIDKHRQTLPPVALFSVEAGRALDLNTARESSLPLYIVVLIDSTLYGLLVHASAPPASNNGDRRWVRGLPFHIGGHLCRLRGALTARAIPRRQGHQLESWQKHSHTQFESGERLVDLLAPSTGQALDMVCLPSIARAIRPARLHLSCLRGFESRELHQGRKWWQPLNK